jgi:AraC family transcriptional regulator, regulatory protein of adaptative response / DNA-3-methyladenine glycosylase II
MQLDADTCYRALRSRDRRFEGRFYVGVVTTGVYCRPGCPAPAARRENVRFYACAAAAEADGFRACFRCRPDAAPGTPAWFGTSATVSRALRLISEGALDGDDAEALASRLGVGTRHLRRLFAQHLGASPAAVAQTRRLHFARKLLEETELPIAQVAMAAGFGSVRRFNAAMRATFDRAPRDLRGDHAAKSGELVLRLPYRKPFDWEGLLAFLGPRAIAGVEEVQGGVYRRGDVEVTNDDGFLRLRLLAPAKNLFDVVERVRRLFDLRADPQIIGEHLSRDPLLAKRIKKHPGVRVPGAWDPFEMAVRAVLGQQISVERATILAGQLAAKFGLTPEALVDANINGMPAARAETLRGLARAALEGKLVLDGSRSLEDTVENLKTIPGVGDWTAHYIAMRAASEPDAFPAGDLGLRKAYPGDDLAARAESWRPWRAYAAMLLWREP